MWGIVAALILIFVSVIVEGLEGWETVKELRKKLLQSRETKISHELITTITTHGFTILFLHRFFSCFFSPLSLSLFVSRCTEATSPKFIWWTMMNHYSKSTLVNSFKEIKQIWTEKLETGSLGTSATEKPRYSSWLKPLEDTRPVASGGCRKKTGCLSPMDFPMDFFGIIMDDHHFIPKILSMKMTKMANFFWVSLLEYPHGIRQTLMSTSIQKGASQNISALVH